MLLCYIDCYIVIIQANHQKKQNFFFSVLGVVEASNCFLSRRVVLALGEVRFPLPSPSRIR